VAWRDQSRMMGTAIGGNDGGGCPPETPPLQGGVQRRSSTVWLKRPRLEPPRLSG